VEASLNGDPIIDFTVEQAQAEQLLLQDWSGYSI
jgi:hypothetical protein